MVASATQLGLYFCLSRYLLSPELHEQISLLLYYEEYTYEALPALASFSVTEFVHRVLGAIFLILGVLQFNTNFRTKRMALHRTLGKLYFLFCLTSAVSGAIFAWMIPFGGFYESILVSIVAILLLYYTYKAWATIRQGQVEQHQRYTRYTYGIGAGVVIIRLIAHLLFATTSLPDPLVLNIALTAGWILSLAVIYYYHHLLDQDSPPVAAGA